ncbi:glutamate receptor 2.2 [Rhynchospora pubera]|uniref:Glutamate receptor 2.2 n=1 Tax=Rhynchospora pubera TaxID=906938 RepID=A0AAV8HEF4_9POAL|nr:glutamate receptor 2.2 [Rhynchospora pubera]
MHVPYFVRTAINDVAQVKTITSLIKHFEWLEVVLISEDTEFGWGIIPFLIDDLQKIHVQVAYRSLINISSTNDQIQQELYKLQTMQTRVFIVHMSSSMGSTLFLNAKEVGMMSEGYVWIMTSGVADMVNSFNPKVIRAMNGALGVRLHVPLTKELGDFTTRWRKRFHEDNPEDLVFSELPSIYALWAYDTIYALAMAVENLGVEITQSGSNPASPKSPLRVFSMGPQLLQALFNIKFQGLAGTFELIGGQLNHTAFEIINVVGGIREIAYWTEDKGFSKPSEAARNSKTQSTSQLILDPIWPGEPKGRPKGWEIPVSGRKLRVGVIKGFGLQFMNVEVDPETKAVKPSGYAVDVFLQAINRLSFGLQYEYQLFGDTSQADSLTYDYFVNQVHLEGYNIEDWHEALDNRSVAAIIDEVPYIKSFLTEHCNLYTMIPVYKTAGFGFVSRFL